MTLAVTGGGAEAARIADEAREVPASPTRPPVELASGVHAVDVISEHGPLDERSRQLVEDLRGSRAGACDGATAGSSTSRTASPSTSSCSRSWSW